MRTENKKINEFTLLANEALQRLQLADALRYNYWALVLLRSHPDNNTIRNPIAPQNQRLLIHALNDQIIDLLRNINARVINVVDEPGEKRVITLRFSYKGQQLENYEYTYWTGNDRSNPVSCSNGIGLVELFGREAAGMKEIRIYSEYKFENLCRTDEDLRSVFADTELPTFRQETFVVKLPDTDHQVNQFIDKTISASDGQAAYSENFSATALNSVIQPENYARFVANFTSAIRSNNISSLTNACTPEGYQMVRQLLANGSVRVLHHPDTLSVVQMNNGEVMVRSIPMSFSYNNNTRTFTENVSMFFDAAGKLSSLSFSIGQKAIEDIMAKEERFGTVGEKFQLIRFMEDYKTAYCMKRLDFIEKVFSDNALIIVGNILKPDPSKNLDKMYGSLSNEKVQYIRLSKKQYLDRLRVLFRTNEFVNIHFEDNVVKKIAGHDKIYGIQIAQHYFSSTYSDKGYLFLMIDLNDSLNPRIYVRSWQPERNPDGSIIGLQDFYF